MKTVEPKAKASTMRHVDPTIARGAAKRQAGRQRVCEACVRPNDVALGRVHSELPCTRCRRAPCFGIITVGTLQLPIGDSET
jgi:hypothetical protein